VCAKLRLATLDCAVEQPDVGQECDRRKRACNEKESADLDGDGTNGDELHGCLPGRSATYPRVRL
jgi:hypothetical protein